jgi:hypothetical protein
MALRHLGMEAGELVDEWWKDEDWEEDDGPDDE